MEKLVSDDGAAYDKVVVLTAEDILPQVTWGTNPGMVTDIHGQVPDPQKLKIPTNEEPSNAPWLIWISNLIPDC